MLKHKNGCVTTVTVKTKYVIGAKHANPLHGPLSVMWFGVSLICVTVLSALTEAAESSQFIS